MPLRRHYDYLVGARFSQVEFLPGMRVSVPFGRRKEQVGMVLSVADRTSLKPEQLKSISNVIDAEPLFSPRHFDLLRWAADYYHHPVGEALFNSLPVLLRQGKPVERGYDEVFTISAAGREADAGNRAPAQQALLGILRAHPAGLTRQELRARQAQYARPLNALLEKGLVTRSRGGRIGHDRSDHGWSSPDRRDPGLDGPGPSDRGLSGTGPSDPGLSGPDRSDPNRSDPDRSDPDRSGPDRSGTKVRGFELNQQQAQAVDSITANTDSHHTHVLRGITGSGKTEVYIEAVRHVIAQRRQALILVPEIGLTTQFIDRLRQRLAVDIRVQHSALNETERLRNWLAAKNGDAPVVIGTRSAVWTPLKSPGIYVVDEEHDSSYKQDRGFHYSARDIAVVRGKFDDVPVVLGSATPSLETMRNVKTRKYSQQNLPARASGAKSPEIRFINLRHEPVFGAVSKTLLNEIAATLERNNQALLFLNRRGYAPVILCHSCGWYAECNHCSAKMAFHKDKRCLVCHHCDARKSLPNVCPDCAGAELVEVGHGTQRLDHTLAEHFPEARILRIDRDSTRRKGSMEKMIKEITTGDADILIGTQMLAKGHHFPRLTLAGIIDADAGLLSTDFRASERMAQLIVQVSGRAGREDRPGTVYIQTHFPGHPLLRTLVTQGYAGFAGLLLRERRQAQLPPYACLALLEAEAGGRETAEKFLYKARDHLKNDNGLTVFGPVAAPIEKRRGRYRSQLLIQSGNRTTLRKVLAPWCRSLEAMPEAKRTKWHLDIDPQDTL